MNFCGKLWEQESSADRLSIYTAHRLNLQYNNELAPKGRIWISTCLVREGDRESRMYNGVYNKEQYAYMYDTLTKWLAVRIQGRSLGDTLLAKGIQKVALYGVSGLGELVYGDIRDSGVEILCFIDKNAERYKGEKNGLAVLNLKQLEQLSKDCYILVTPEFFFREIMRDLLDKGIPLERIISLSMVVG